MKIKQKELSENYAQLSIVLEKEDYFGEYESALKQYRKQINMPGFRPGKVPMGLVKKQYGKSILADEVFKVLNSGITDHIREKQLNIIGSPIPVVDEEPIGDWDNPSSFEFKYEMGIAPEVQLKLTKKNKFDYHVIKIDKKMIDQQVEDFTRRFGALSDPEVSEEKDLLVGTFVELGEDKAIKPGGVMNDATISLEFVTDKKSKKKLVGLKAGEIVVVDPEKVSKDHDDLGRMLGISHEEVHSLNSDFQFTVNEIKRLKPHEINQELFDKVFGEGKVSDEKAFREKVSDQIKSILSKDTDRLFKRDFTTELLDKLIPSLPDGFIQNWVNYNAKEPIPESEMDNQMAAVKNGLKWQLIENKVIQDFEIKATDEEVLDFTANLMRDRYSQYGMNLEDEQANSLAQNTLENEEERKNIIAAIYEDKVIAALKEKVSIKEKEVSYDDFLALASKA